MSAAPNNAWLWVQKAEEDWVGMNQLLEATPTQWTLVCFHAQQAAEKYLKAFLVSHGLDPERTHDLLELLDACLSFDSTLALLRDDCLKLTEYAVDVRYPDIPVSASEQTAREAATKARHVRTEMRKRMQ